MSTNGKRKPAEATLIAALAAGCTQAKAAHRSGLSERTVARRLDDPCFRAEVARARSVMLERTLAMLAEATVEAVTTLQELVRDGSPSIRLGAARAILDYTAKFRDQTDFAVQLDRIEAVVESGFAGR